MGALRQLGIALLALVAAGNAFSQAALLTPTGTLRVSYLASNPAQARQDPATKAISGPAADLARELGRRLGVSVQITPVNGTAAVLNSVKSGTADIGFLAHDPARAAEVDFSQPYLIAWNTYMVPANSPLLSAAEVDLPGVRVGVGQGDAGHLFLQRTLKNAQIRTNAAGSMSIAVQRLESGEIDAYAANRTRILEALAQWPGFRVMPDNFLGVQQAIIVRKGEPARLEPVNRMIDEARASGLIQAAIDRAGLKGVDVAPPGKYTR